MIWVIVLLIVAVFFRFILRTVYCSWSLDLLYVIILSETVVPVLLSDGGRSDWYII